MQSSVLHRGLPLCFFSFILPSWTSFSNMSPRIIACHSLIKLVLSHLSSTLCNTSSLVTWSVDLFFSILLYIRVSTASIPVKHHASDVHNSTLRTNHLLQSFIEKLSPQFLLFTECILATAALDLISAWHLLSSVIKLRLPKYLNAFSCSNIQLLQQSPIHFYYHISTSLTVMIFVFFLSINLHSKFRCSDSQPVHNPLKSFFLSANVAWSAEKRTACNSLPPTAMLSWQFCMAFLISSSSQILNSSGDSGQSCLAPWLIIQGCDYTSPSLRDAKKKKRHEAPKLSAKGERIEAPRRLGCGESVLDIVSTVLVHSGACYLLQFSCDTSKETTYVRHSSNINQHPQPTNMMQIFLHNEWTWSVHAAGRWRSTINWVNSTTSARMTLNSLVGCFDCNQWRAQNIGHVEPCALKLWWERYAKWNKWKMWTGK